MASPAEKEVPLQEEPIEQKKSLRASRGTLKQPTQISEFNTKYELDPNVQSAPS